MRPDCARAVAEARGREVTTAELDDIEARMTRALRTTAHRNPQAWLGMSQHEWLDEAATVAAQESVEERIRQQRRVATLVNETVRREPTVGQPE